MPAPTYVGLFSSQNTNSASIINRTWPAGHASGDVGMVFVAYRYGDGLTGRPTVTCADTTFYECPGFPVLLDNPSSGLDTDKVYLTCFYGYAVSGTMAQITINGSQWFRQNSLVIRGTGGSGAIYPFHRFGVLKQESTASNVVTFPSLNTTSPDTLFLHYSVLTNVTLNNAANFTTSLTNADLTDINVRSNLGSTALEGAGHIFITGTRSGIGASAQGTGITTVANSTNISVVFAMGGDPYTAGYPAATPFYNLYARRRGRR